MAEETTPKHVTYEDAGVDTAEGARAVDAIKAAVASTNRPEVIGGLGGFGSCFSAAALKDMEEPVLVSGTDGVGTKLAIAQLLNRNNTVGQDLVAMCVDDVVVVGAEPLFFLDYVAIGKLKAETVAPIVEGIAEGCRMSGCALVGGEMAEHPGVMAVDDYDLAGFVVGVVDRPKMIGPELVHEGDVILGLPSSGIHSNGYSLVRKVFDIEHADLDEVLPGLDRPLGEVLLTPTRIYVKPVLAAFEAADVRGVSHITGGGFYENIPRCIPDGLGAVIRKDAVRTPAIFRVLQEKGGIPERDMFNTFNMGVGMVLVVSPETADAALASLKTNGVDAYVLGEIRASEEKVTLC